MTGALIAVVAVATVAGMSPLLRAISSGPVAVLKAVPDMFVNVAVTLAAGLVAVAAFGTYTHSYRMLPVLSGSMNPGMSKGDVAWIEPVPLDDLAVGDVIVFEAPADAPGPWAGLPIIHRVHEIVDANDVIDPQDDARYFRTKGDAVEDPDPWILEITAETVMARNGVVPGVGKAIEALSSQNVGKTALGLCVATIVFTGIRSVISGIRETDRKARPKQDRRDWWRWKPFGATLIGVGSCVIAVVFWDRLFGF